MCARANMRVCACMYVCAGTHAMRAQYTQLQTPKHALILLPVKDFNTVYKGDAWMKHCDTISFQADVVKTNTPDITRLLIRI